MLVSTKQSLSDKQLGVSVPDNRAFIAFYLGIIHYEKALKMQETLMQARINGRIADVLLLLQHPPVVTIGRFRGEGSIRVSLERLHQEGIAVFNTNRGGSVTYHGLGQLVGYPILDLRNNHLSVREYVHQLEEVIIEAIYNFGIQGKRIKGFPGVWVNGKKICSIGIHVSHYVTMHGFALNVNTNLQHFSYINPCGDSRISMTSMSQLLEEDISIETVANEVVNSFSKVFDSSYEQGLNRCSVIFNALHG